MTYFGNIEHNNSIYKAFALFLIILGIFNIAYFIFGILVGWSFYFGMNMMAVFGAFIFLYGIFRLKKGIIKLSAVQKTLDICIIAIIISFIIVEGLICSAMQPGSSKSVDYVLVLGAGIRNNYPTPELKNRLDESMEFVKENPGVKKVILCGGKGPDENMSEAAVMSTYLTNQGFDRGMLVEEIWSTSTFENIRNARDIIMASDPGRDIKAAIVTNDFHVYRAKLIARRLGLNPVGVPSRTPLYIIPNHHVREYFAIMKTLVFDR